MIRPSFVFLSIYLAAMAPAGVAAPRDDLLARYASEARASDPAFTTFAAARGESLHRTRHGGGKADTPACSSCHGEDARAAGRTRTGKAIEPMAASVTPKRYADPAKVEKWFKRNCNEVLGRECTPREKGDWLAYMMNQ
jgi:mono/diheme cytochrome c family protein